MKSKLIRVGTFLRLLDDDCNLSLTNLSVWISIVNLALAPAATAPLDVVAFVGALASYQAKRKLNSAS